MKLIHHIFGEQFELGMDYMQLLNAKPTQKLPILLLVSEERDTGKTTFLNFLKAVFEDNVTFIPMRTFEANLMQIGQVSYLLLLTRCCYVDEKTLNV